MTKKSFLIIGFFFVSFLNGQEKYLNLDFETSIYGTGLPKVWNTIEGSGSIQMDSLDFVSGKKSLKFNRTNTNSKKPSILLSKLPKNLVSSDTLNLIGFIKTDNVQNGFVGLMVRVDGNDQILAFDNMADRGLSGTNDWTEVSIQVAIPKNADDIYIGSIFVGSGTAYLDSFKLILDKKSYQDKARNVRLPDHNDLRWLSKNVYPLRGFNPNDKYSDDLNFLKEKVKNAKLIGLGEASHGSKEIFLMKHRLLKFFQSELGFSHFSMEADMTRSNKLNSYVTKGMGDPKVLLKGLGFWTWYTEEVLELVEWMHEKNERPRLDKPIVFSGFDLQFTKDPILELRKQYSFNNDDLTALETKLDSLKRGKINKSLNQSIIDELDGLNALVLKKNLPLNMTARMVQNIRLAKQSLDLNLKTNRDRFMAENVRWLYNREGTSKMVLWAHNGHVKRSGDTMGSYLKEYFGAEYISIGFAFHSGSYSAKGKDGVMAYTAQSSYPGTYEHFFNTIEQPIFLIDLRQIRNRQDITNWLNNEMEFRVVGANKLTTEFYPTKLIDDFDFLIFIKETFASNLILD